MESSFDALGRKYASKSGWAEDVVHRPLTQDLHKEVKEYQTDIKAAVDGARAGTQTAMGGGPSALASVFGESGQASPFGSGSGSGSEADGGAAAGGQAAAV